MLIYAGIDEAGYGPILGPLVISRAVFAFKNHAVTGNPSDLLKTQNTKNAESSRKAEGDSATGASGGTGGTGASGGALPDLWELLQNAVCKRLAGARGRIPINDSKKLKTKAAGLTHLERGVLSFASLWKPTPHTTDQWLDLLGEQAHHDLGQIPWYHAPDQPLPLCLTRDELAVGRKPLSLAMAREGIQMLELGSAVVFEDRFNRMVAATRSKASVNFTFVSSHLDHLWHTYGKHDLHVIIDRQSGRSHYLRLLTPVFPDADATILEETPSCSRYRLKQGERTMTIHFLVEAEASHLPVALASMVCKYTRERLMQRLNAWFIKQLPDLNLKPTAGYAQDGKRFLAEITPRLDALGIKRQILIRQR